MSKNGLAAVLGSIILLLLFLPSLQAQKVEIGLNGGIANYQGDLAEQEVDFATTSWSAGLFLRYNWTKYFSLRGGIGSGDISGTDANAKDKSRIRRNLSFFTNVTDVYMVAELYPLGFQAERRARKKIYPYFFAGLAVFHFNPKTIYNNQVYELQPLGTEGQGLAQYPATKKYSLTQVSYPMGIGIKYNLGRHWNIGAELRYCRTFTDYIDDVSGSYANPEYLSVRGNDAVALADRRFELGYPPVTQENVQRGNPDRKDSYIFSGITISYMPRKFTCYKF